MLWTRKRCVFYGITVFCLLVDALPLRCYSRHVQVLGGMVFLGRICDGFLLAQQAEKTAKSQAKKEKAKGKKK
jgi:hypothetical protein